MTQVEGNRIRVFAIDDHEVVRLGMRFYFDTNPDLELIGDAADGQSALRKLRELAEQEELPDVVLMDLVMKGLDGRALTQEIKREYPEVEVVVVTSYGENQRVLDALAAGATGFVLKDSDVDDIDAAVKAAHSGRVHLDPSVTRSLADAVIAPSRGAAALTAREREVLTLIGRGKSNKEIGNELAISERTVYTHTGNILTKLGIRSRTEAALWSIREGLVTI